MSKSAVKLIRYKAHRQVAPLSLATFLGLGAIHWLGISAIAPTIAQAYTARVNVAINRIEGESFQTMLHRAEIVARAAAQRSFDRDILVTDVAVIVMAQNEGYVAPIVSLEVSRQQWKRSPDPRQWVRYFPNAQSLLQFETVGQIPGSTPPVTTPSTPTPRAPEAVPPVPAPPGTVTQPDAPAPPGQTSSPGNDVPSPQLPEASPPVPTPPNGASNQP